MTSEGLKKHKAEMLKPRIMYTDRPENEVRNKGTQGTPFAFIQETKEPKEPKETQGLKEAEEPAV